jgi:hypothetical protein
MKISKRVGYFAISIIILSLVVLSLCKTPNQYMGATPLFIGQDFDLLRSPLSPSVVRLAALQGYEERVNQSVTSNGITLTIGNIYADSLQFEFDMVESFSNQTENQPVIRDQDIKMDINGTEPLSGFSGGEFQQADGNRYAGVVFMPMGNLMPLRVFPTGLLPEEFVLNVHVSQIGNIEGSWNFSIPVSQAKLIAATHVYLLNIEKTSGGDTFEVLVVDAAPNQTIIQIRFIEPGSGQPDLLAGRGRYRLLVTDENNKSFDEQLAAGMVSTKGGNRVYDVLFSTARLPDTTKKLIITPLVRQDWLIARISEGSPITTTGLPEFTDPLGSLAIESLNFVTDSQKTMMYLVMNSSYDTRPMRQLYLETTESNGIGMLLPKDMYFANNHEMVAEFPKLDPSKQYFFRVEAYKPLTELSIPVEIK